LNEMKAEPKAVKVSKMTPVKKMTKMSLEAVSDKSLFDSIPSKKIVQKRTVLKTVLDDLE